MSWSLNIGTIAGTAVRVHVTFLLFLGWIFAASWVVGRAAGGLAVARLPAAAVRLRGGARIRPHLHRARVRRVDARRDAAADRRRRAARAHPGRAVRGVPGRHRRPAGERGDRHRLDHAAGARRECGRSLRGRKPAYLDDRSARRREPVPRGVQHDPGLSRWTAGGFCARSSRRAWAMCAPPRSPPSSAKASPLRSGSSGCSPTRC